MCMSMSMSMSTDVYEPAVSLPDLTWYQGHGQATGPDEGHAAEHGARHVTARPLTHHRVHDRQKTVHRHKRHDHHRHLSAKIATTVRLEAASECQRR